MEKKEGERKNERKRDRGKGAVRHFQLSFKTKRFLNIESKKKTGSGFGNIETGKKIIH